MPRNVSPSPNSNLKFGRTALLFWLVFEQIKQSEKFRKCSKLKERTNLRTNDRKKETKKENEIKWGKKL